MADPSIRELADKVDDLSRLVARQSGVLAQVADPRGRGTLDVALLVDLHALRGEALTAAGATRSGRERGAFEAIAAGLERLLAGRGGALVAPRPGHPFSAATMEAAEEVACADASLDRTVATLLAPGLEAEGRTVRPARVAIHRYAPQSLATQPEEAGPEEAGPQEARPQEAGPEPATMPEPAARPARAERTGTARGTVRKTTRAARSAAAAEPESVRRTRAARRAHQPEPQAESRPESEPRPEAPAPAKRTARKRPAPTDQPTSAASAPG